MGRRATAPTVMGPTGRVAGAVAPVIQFGGRTAGNRLGASACRRVGAAVRNRQNQLRPPSPLWPVATRAVLTLTRPSENGSDPEGIAESFSVNPDNYQRQTHTPRTQPQ